jgi:hypothetical protein
MHEAQQSTPEVHLAEQGAERSTLAAHLHRGLVFARAERLLALNVMREHERGTAPHDEARAVANHARDEIAALEKQWRRDCPNAADDSEDEAIGVASKIRAQRMREARLTGDVFIPPKGVPFDPSPFLNRPTRVGASIQLAEAAGVSRERLTLAVATACEELLLPRLERPAFVKVRAELVIRNATLFGLGEYAAVVDMKIAADELIARAQDWPLTDYFKAALWAVAGLHSCTLYGTSVWQTAGFLEYALGAWPDLWCSPEEILTVVQRVIAETIAAPQPRPEAVQSRLDRGLASVLPVFPANPLV